MWRENHSCVLAFPVTILCFLPLLAVTDFSISSISICNSVNKPSVWGKKDSVNIFDFDLQEPGNCILRNAAGRKPERCGCCTNTGFIYFSFYTKCASVYVWYPGPTEDTLKPRRQPPPHPPKCMTGHSWAPLDSLSPNPLLLTLTRKSARHDSCPCHHTPNPRRRRRAAEIHRSASCC